MRMILTTAAVAAALWGCTSAIYTETADEIRLHAGFGGFINPIIKRYAEWDQSGKAIVIDGHMISADAFGAFSAKNACYTENAIFSPHAASELGLIPNYKRTDQLARMLPEELEVWFRESGAYHDWVGIAMAEYPDLLRIWPEGACDKDHTAGLARWQTRRDGELAEIAAAQMR